MKRMFAHTVFAVALTAVFSALADGDQSVGVNGYIPPGGSFRLNENVYEGVEVFSPYGVTHLFSSGATATFTANPLTGWKVDCWYRAYGTTAYTAFPGTAERVGTGLLEYSHAYDYDPARNNGYVTLAVAFDYLRYEVGFWSEGRKVTSAKPNYTNEVSLATCRPTRDGYALTGWSFGGGARTFATNAVCTGSTFGITNHDDSAVVSLSAMWQARQYTVSFDMNGHGETPAAKTVTYDGTYGELPIPTCEGYAFDGWFTASEDGTNVTASTKVEIARNHTLYAHWTQQFHVIFQDGPQFGAGTIGDVVVRKGESVTPPSAPAHPGYTFIKWEGWAGFDNIEQDRIYTASYSAISYPLTYHSNNGENQTEVDHISWGERKPLIVAPFALLGHVFSGWSMTAGGEPYYKGNESVAGEWVAENPDLYACWEPIQYKVRFNPNGGAGTMPDQVLTFGVEQMLSANLFTKPGVEFRHWLGQDGKIYPDMAPVCNMTIDPAVAIEMTAVWSENYSVAFDANGAAGEMTPIDFADSQESRALTSVGFAKTGYTFLGWSTNREDAAQWKWTFADGEKVSDLAAPGETLTLFACWTNNAYTVKFNRGVGASGMMANEVFYYDEPKALPDCTFVRQPADIWTFVGWSNTVSGVTYPTNGVGQVIVSNLTAQANGVVALEAMWESNLTELSRAMKCDNLRWISEKQSNTESVWKVADSGEGVMHSADENFADLTASVVTNGVLRFNVKSENVESLEIYVETEDDFLTITNLAVTTEWTPIEVLIDKGTKVGEEEPIPLTFPCTIIIESKEGENHFIDQMKWEPEGSEPEERVVVPTAVSGLVYDGNVKTGVVEGVNYTLVGSTATAAGAYVATATLPEEGYLWADGSSAPMDIKWTIAKSAKDITGVTFEDATFDYDGNSHSFAVANLPEGVEVIYEGETNRTEVGVNEVTARFRVKDAGNWSEITETLTAKLTIRSPFAPHAKPVAKTGLVYDGTKQTGVVAGDGYTLVGNEATAAGVYVATATLSEKGNAWEDGSSEPVEIEWAIAKGDKSVSGVTFADATFKYDGKAHSIGVTGEVPAGVRVVYTGGVSRTEVGTNEVTATFQVTDPFNWNAIATTLTAKLVITSKEEPPVPPPGPVITNKVPVAVTGLVYDGNVKTGVVEGVNYTLAGHVATTAGVYVATATLPEKGFVWENGSSDPVEIKWTIAKGDKDVSGVTFADAAFEYDGQPHSFGVVGEIPDGVEVVYDGATNRTEVGTNVVTASFRVSDTNNWNEITNTLTAALVIIPLSPGLLDNELHPGGTIGAFTAQYAVTYNGWLREIATSNIVGTITVKTTAAKSGKPCKVTIYVTPIGGKKKTFKTSFVPGEGRIIDIYGIIYGATGLAGTFCDGVVIREPLVVEAAKDFSKSKLGEEKELTGDYPVGCYTVALGTGEGQTNGFDCLSVTVAKKTGKAKVTGTLDDGTKFSLSCQGVLGQSFAVPVVLSGKKNAAKEPVSFGLVVWIEPSSRTVNVSGLQGGRWPGGLYLAKELVVQPAEREYRFGFDLPAYRDYLTAVDGFAVAPTDAVYQVTGKKWNAGKTVGSVKVDKTTGAPYVQYKPETQVPANLPKLKFSYTPKTGVVKGSFKLYYLLDGKLKTDSAAITGIAVDAVLCGNGVIKVNKKKEHFPLWSEIPVSP